MCASTRDLVFIGNLLTKQVILLFFIIYSIIRKLRTNNFIIILMENSILQTVLIFMPDSTLQTALLECLWTFLETGLTEEAKDLLTVADDSVNNFKYKGHLVSFLSQQKGIKNTFYYGTTSCTPTKELMFFIGFTGPVEEVLEVLNICLQRRLQLAPSAQLYVGATADQYLYFLEVPPYFADDFYLTNDTISVQKNVLDSDSEG